MKWMHIKTGKMPFLNSLENSASHGASFFPQQLSATEMNKDSFVEKMHLGASLEY